MLSFTCTLKGSREVIGLNSININPLNPDIFAVAGESSEVFEYDLRKIRAGECLRAFQPGDAASSPHHHVTCLAFSENGNELLATYSGGKILKFDSSSKSSGKEVLQSYQGGCFDLRRIFMLPIIILWSNVSFFLSLSLLRPSQSQDG